MYGAGFVPWGRGCESVLWLQKTPEICKYMYLRKEGHSHGWKSYPWGYTCLSCGSSILWNIPDFACYKIHAMNAPTPLLFLNTHQAGKKMGQKRVGVYLCHLISLFAQEVSDGSHFCWLLLLWFSMATLQGICKCLSCLTTPSPGLGARPLSTASGMMPTVWRKSLFVSAVGHECP